MSKESKMALLVGLGFIITFGAILSEARSDKLKGSSGAVELAMDKVVMSPAPRPLSARIPAVHRNVTIFQSPASANNRHESAEVPGPAEIAVDDYARRRSVAINTNTRDTRSTRDTSNTRDTHNNVSATDGRQAKDAARYLGVYTVSDGDNLTRIARKVYGSGGEKRYMDIYRANTDKLSDADSISVGMELLIPR